LSNCQTEGLAHSLSLLNSDIDFEYCDIVGFEKDPGLWADQIDRCDKIVVNPQSYDSALDKDQVAGRTIIAPGIYFPGFHPDQCLLYDGEEMFRGCLGVYHSVIAYAGYCKALSVADTCSLFGRATYDRLGYFDTWPEAESDLLAHFARHGLDISPAFRRWCRGRSFMHTNHHPKIDCLYDVAQLILEANGQSAWASDIRPLDNLVMAASYPVYDEIARELGFRGSYRFKPPGTFRCLDLERFVEGSFAAYAAADHGPLAMDPSRQGAFDRLLAVI
jgi:hypothetical protein